MNLLNNINKEKVFYSLSWGKTRHLTESQIFNRLRDAKKAVDTIPLEYPHHTIKRHMHCGIDSKGRPQQGAEKLLESF